ncbi:hypothetical protein GmHk_07G020312 [Glycine max]|nr:hypothetical protein GmHk_07G020312 [Glycine max]
MAQSNSSRLGFPALISTLCVGRGVVSDSLTFESLSPAINLAYIKKNCWNLDDPTIVFLGTCKARARGSEGLSSSATPAPASSAPTPSPTPAPSTSAPPLPSAPSFHCGLCLVMQSMHDSAQHRPIISIEEFTSQEPQLQLEVPHEATPEATPRTSLVTSPVLEVFEEEDGVADADYAADMTAT